MDTELKLKPQVSPIIPATLENLKNLLGFHTFFEAYEWLVQIDYLQKENVGIQPPIKETDQKAPDTVYFLINEIKAGAMDEVYKLLPTSVEYQQLKRQAGQGLSVVAQKITEKIPYKL